jgi:hypothetical protein
MGSERKVLSIAILHSWGDGSSTTTRIPLHAIRTYHYTVDVSGERKLLLERTENTKIEILNDAADELRKILDTHYQDIGSVTETF